MSEFLSPLRSAQLISQLSQNVKINESAVKRLAHELWGLIRTGGYDINRWKEHELHPKIADDSALDWIFLVDSLNFSFWTEPASPKYTVEYKGQEYTGYWSLCAAINRAIDQNIPVTKPEFYSKIDETTLAKILRGEGNVEIPLLKERCEILNENGKILIEKFSGSFKSCIQMSGNSASTLVKLVVDNFPSYQDQTEYYGHRVSFYKRAQILVADVWACFEGTNSGLFTDIDSLTMFPDYRVPQILYFYGVLEYSKQLIEILSGGVLMRNGDPIETEIRGLSIYAVHLLTQELLEIQKNQIESDAPSPHHNDSDAQKKPEKKIALNSVLIDFILWDMRREKSLAIDSCIPFHRVRCIYY